MSVRAEHAAFDLPGVRLHALIWGPPGGRLVLCLHGFPDAAQNWGPVARILAARGLRVVAPIMRGYAPTGPVDGGYHIGTLMADVLALHQHLGAPADAAVIGHDWGAFVVNGLLAHPGSPFSAHITMAVPNMALLARASGALLRKPPVVLRQLRNSWYVLFFQLPWLPERVLHRVIPRLWKDWGPSGATRGEELSAALAALPTRRHRNAAVAYYRTLARGTRPSGPAADLQRCLWREPQRPVLHLQGLEDGAITGDFTNLVESHLPAGSRVVRVSGAGHFLQVERPDVVSAAILGHLATTRGEDGPASGDSVGEAI